MLVHLWWSGDTRGIRMNLKMLDSFKPQKIISLVTESENAWLFSNYKWSFISHIIANKKNYLNSSVIGLLIAHIQF